MDLRYGVGALLCSVTAQVSAVPMLDNGVGASSSYIVSDNSPGADQVVADDFVVPAGFVSLTGIRWRGTYAKKSTPVADAFAVNIFADAAAAVAASPLYSVQPKVVRTGPDTEFFFDYEATFAPLALTAGSTYWLSIFEDLSADFRWSWLQGRGGNLRYENTAKPDFALQIPYAVDFQLFGETSSVPEPSSFTLFAAASLLAQRRRAPVRGV